MRIGPLGPRELVATALLGIAIIAGISVTFLRDDNEPQRSAAELLNATATTTATQTLPPTFTPTPERTPVPENLVAIERPGAWLIQFADVSARDDSLSVTSTGSRELLDLNYPAAPFGDMRDNQWAVLVEASIRGDEGRWLFTIEFKGSVKIEIDGVLVVERTSAEVTPLQIGLLHAGGDAVLRIEGRDTDGPFVLRWPEASE
jgi:hypothetical protein